jgi:hypothetical protein
MNSFFKNLSLCFSGGSLGGVVNALVVWIFGVLGIAQALGVNIAPAMTPPFLYSKIVWGGIWGAIFLMPVLKKSPFIRGLIFSLAPTLVQLFVVFPVKLWKGMLGIDLGSLTPVLVIIYNAFWGITAAYWLKATSD